MVQQSRSTTASTIPINSHTICEGTIPQSMARAHRGDGSPSSTTTRAKIPVLRGRGTFVPPLLPNTLPNSHSTAYPLHLISVLTSGSPATRINTGRRVSSVTHTYIIIKDKRIYIYKHERPDTFPNYPWAHFFYVGICDRTYSNPVFMGLSASPL